jgi:hypothetical protein
LDQFHDKSLYTRSTGEQLLHWRTLHLSRIRLARWHEVSLKQSISNSFTGWFSPCLSSVQQKFKLAVNCSGTNFIRVPRCCLTSHVQFNNNQNPLPQQGQQPEDIYVRIIPIHCNSPSRRITSASMAGMEMILYLAAKLVPTGQHPGSQGLEF